jgi:membrane protein YdbS with pleckstrin-like domain
MALRHDGIATREGFGTLRPDMDDKADAPGYADVFRIERPAPALMKYYTLVCLMTGPLFPILIIPNYFRYHTLRYRFDREGISMRWGILFRREINLTYTRIQDIHLTSNLVERWLGLARIQVQTASGTSSAEMTIEGIHEFEHVRDFLYSRMRGHDKGSDPFSVPDKGSDPLSAVLNEAAASLKEAADLIRSRRAP